MHRTLPRSPGFQETRKVRLPTFRVNMPQGPLAVCGTFLQDALN